MILVFLGSVRSTLIVVISIPLSMLVSIVALDALGNSLNVMTLGGLSLAVGILVDDATVELENMHRHIARGEPLVKAILNGAREIAQPAFVSTLCICIVFVPVVFITGPAKFLFIPLAEAVVFAMLTSYFLSRTLVPTLAHYLLEREAAEHHGGEPQGNGLGARFVRAFEHGFARLRGWYGSVLALALAHRRIATFGFVGFVGDAAADIRAEGRPAASE